MNNLISDKIKITLLLFLVFLPVALVFAQKHIPTLYVDSNIELDEGYIESEFLNFINTHGYYFYEDFKIYTKVYADGSDKTYEDALNLLNEFKSKSKEEFSGVFLIYIKHTDYTVALRAIPLNTNLITSDDLREILRVSDIYNYHKAGRYEDAILNVAQNIIRVASGEDIGRRKTLNVKSASINPKNLRAGFPYTISVELETNFEPDNIRGIIRSKASGASPKVFYFCGSVFGDKIPRCKEGINTLNRTLPNTYDSLRKGTYYLDVEAWTLLESVKARQVLTFSTVDTPPWTSTSFMNATNSKYTDLSGLLFGIRSLDADIEEIEALEYEVYGTEFKLNGSEYFGKTTSPSKKCYDSDNGKKYYTKGTVKVEEDISTGNYYDICLNNGDVLEEWYCGSDGKVHSVKYKCPKECKDGACIRAEEDASLPVADFTWFPHNPTVVDTVTFDAYASYDPDGFIVEYEWDFGDGYNYVDHDGNMYHKYDSPGTYAVKLTVTDNDGFTHSTTSLLDVSLAQVKRDGEGLACEKGRYLNLGGIECNVTLKGLSSSENVLFGRARARSDNTWGNWSNLAYYKYSQSPYIGVVFAKVVKSDDLIKIAAFVNSSFPGEKVKLYFDMYIWGLGWTYQMGPFSTKGPITMEKRFGTFTTYDGLGRKDIDPYNKWADYDMWFATVNTKDWVSGFYRPYVVASVDYQDKEYYDLYKGPETWVGKVKEATDELKITTCYPSSTDKVTLYSGDIEPSVGKVGNTFKISAEMELPSCIPHIRAALYNQRTKDIYTVGVLCTNFDVSNRCVGGKNTFSIEAPIDIPPGNYELWFAVGGRYDPNKVMFFKDVDRVRLVPKEESITLADKAGDFLESMGDSIKNAFVGLTAKTQSFGTSLEAEAGTYTFETTAATTPGAAQKYAADVVLATDLSASMANPTPYGLTKLDLAKEATLRFNELFLTPESISAGSKIGLVGFNEYKKETVDLTNDRQALEEELRGYYAEGVTCISCGLKEAIDTVMKGTNEKRAVVILSDGRSNYCMGGLECGADEAKQEALMLAHMARIEGIRVYTVSFGDDADQYLMERIAETTGGEHFFADAESEDVTNIYSHLAYTIPLMAPPTPPEPDHVGEAAPLNVVLVNDVSESMLGEKMEAAKKAALKFAEKILDEAPGSNIGLVAYSRTEEVIYGNTEEGYLVFTNNKDEIEERINSLIVRETESCVSCGLWRAQNMLFSLRSKKAIVVLTDGPADWCIDGPCSANQARLEAINEAEEAGKGRSIEVYTVSYGEDADIDLAESLARNGEGEHFHATTQNIVDVYSNIADRLMGRKAADVVLITSTSGSMGEHIKPEITKLDVTKDADLKFIETFLSSENIVKGNKMGLVTSNPDYPRKIGLTNDKYALEEEIKSYRAEGGLCLSCSIYDALKILGEGTNKKKAIVLISDSAGGSCMGPYEYCLPDEANEEALALARIAKSYGIDLYTVFLGDTQTPSDSEDLEFMKELAGSLDGRYFHLNGEEMMKLYILAYKIQLTASATTYNLGAVVLSDISKLTIDEKKREGLGEAIIGLTHGVLDSGGNIGLVTYARSVDRTLELTDDRGEVFDEIGVSLDVYPPGPTCASCAMLEGINILGHGTNQRKVMILMTDGDIGGCTQGDCSVDQAISEALEVARMARNRGIKVYTVDYGETGDKDTLEKIAEETGGSYYYASDLNIASIYNIISEKITQAPTVSSEKFSADAVIVTETSKSMGNVLDDVKTGSLDFAETFLGSAYIGTYNKMGIVTYNTDVRHTSRLLNLLDEIKGEIEELEPYETRTCTSCGLRSAIDVINRGQNDKKAIILLAYQMPTFCLGGIECSEEKAKQETIKVAKMAADYGIKVYTIYYGDVIEEEFMKAVAEAGGGKSYRAEGGSTDVYRHLAYKIPLTTPTPDHNSVDVVAVTHLLKTMGDHTDEAIKEALKTFARKITHLEGNNIGLVTYSHEVISYIGLTNSPDTYEPEIYSYRAGTGTCISCGIKKAIEIALIGENAYKYLVVMSDESADGCIGSGSSCEESQAKSEAISIAWNAFANGIRVYTISLGPYADQKLMEAIAESGRGKHYHAEVEDLVDIYENVGDNIITSAGTP